jgi:hypothetical protein
MLVNINTAADLTDYSDIEIRYAKIELEAMMLKLDKELANRGAPINLTILEEV